MLEILVKEIDIPFLFGFWSVIQKVKFIEELKMASFSVLPKYKEWNFCIPQISLIVSRNLVFIKCCT